MIESVKRCDREIEAIKQELRNGNIGQGVRRVAELTKVVLTAENGKSTPATAIGTFWREGI